MPDINDVVDAQREALRRREVSLLDQISNDYQKVVGRILDDLGRLQDKISEARDAGEELNPSWLIQERRYKDLLSQAGRELERFSVQATAETSQEQFVQIHMSERHVIEQADAAAPDLEAGLTFNRLPTRAIESLVGRASDGSPLKDLFDQLGPDLGADLRSELIQAIAVGQSPSATARRIRELVRGNEARAELIARTETLQAYREGGHLTSTENSDVLGGWTWVATLDGRACAACIGLHGSVHTLDERMATHPACRCSQRFETKTFAELGIGGVGETRPPKLEPGFTWLANAPAATQKLVLGDAGYKAWQEGKVELENFIGRRDDPRWGSSYYQRSLKDALKGPQDDVDLGYDRPGEPVPSVPVAKEVPLEPAPPPAPEPALEADGGMTAAEARAQLEKLIVERDAIVGQLQDARRIAYDAYNDPAVMPPSKRKELKSAYIDSLIKRDNAVELYKNKVLDIVGVKDPIKVNADWTAFPGDLNPDRSIYQRGVGYFERMISSKLQPTGANNDLIVKPVTTTVAGRSYPSAYQLGKAIYLTSGDYERTVIHESGHWLENWNYELHKKIVAFLEARTQGEEVKSLAELFPDAGFGPKEKALLDKFLKAYMGKDYSVGPVRTATEILSMGLEYMYAEPLELIKHDPEYFDFIYDLVRGRSIDKYLRKLP